MSNSKKKPILSDHKKIGKSFIPPILQATNVEKTSWLDSALPELVWLGLLNEEYGLRKGSELAVGLAEIARKVAKREGNPWYALISSYTSLPDELWSEIANELEQEGNLNEIRNGLSSLIALYPECPFKYLFDAASLSTVVDAKSTPSHLHKFKDFLERFIPKYKKPATLAQANAIYIAFVSGKLKVVQGVTGFDDFPLVADFPDTEASRRAAASIYPTINILVGTENDSTSPYSWSQYFWNRGLELERCSVSQVVNSYEW